MEHALWLSLLFAMIAGPCLGIVCGRFTYVPARIACLINTATALSLGAFINLFRQGIGMDACSKGWWMLPGFIFMAFGWLSWAISRDLQMDSKTGPYKPSWLDRFEEDNEPVPVPEKKPMA